MLWHLPSAEATREQELLGLRRLPHLSPSVLRLVEAHPLRTLHGGAAALPVAAAPGVILH